MSTGTKRNSDRQTGPPSDPGLRPPSARRERPRSEKNPMKHFSFVLFFAGLTALAQPAAQLQGQLTDEQGKGAGRARIRVFRQGGAAAATAVSNDAGRFEIERLIPGPAVVQIDKDGFRSLTRPIELAPGRNTLDAVLEVAGVAQSISVTATGAAQTFDEIGKAITTVSGEEIQARNEFSIAEALRTTPGIVISNTGGPGQLTTIRTRGLRPDATAVLVDGLRFRDSTTIQGDASSFVSTLNFTGAERLEIVRGSGSSVYGTNAAGGVVNVITQEGGPPLHGGLLFEGGTLGLFRGRGAIGGGALGNRLRYTGSAQHINVTRGVDGNDANRSTSLQGFARYDFTPSLSLSGRFWGSDDFVQLNISPTTAGIPAANFPASGVIPAVMLSPENVRILNAGGAPDFRGVTLIPGRDDPDSRRASRFATTALILRHTLTPRLNWQASYQRVHTARTFHNGPAGTGFQPAAENYSNYVGDIDTVDARLNAIAASWLTLTAGYEFERENYFDFQNNNLPAPRTVISQTAVKQDANAAFVAAQFALLERRLQISLSGRGQFFRMFRPQFVLTGTANNYDRVPLESPPRALTGDAAIAYLIPGTSTKLRAHAGNAYRAPALYERFGGGFSASPVTGEVLFTPYGDPRLAPDRYNSVDAGVDQYLFQDRLRLSATWYYQRAVSLTAFDSSGGIRPDTDPFGRSLGYINGSGGTSRGFELGVEARPSRKLTLTGSYTYTNANLDRDITVRDFWRVLQAPRHVASFVVMQQWTRRLDTSFEFFRSSGYYSGFFAVNRARAFEFPGFTKADLVGGYRVWANDSQSARVYAMVENVFNQRFYQNGWLAPQAAFRGGLQYAF